MAEWKTPEAPLYMQGVEEASPDLMGVTFPPQVRRPLPCSRPTLVLGLGWCGPGLKAGFFLPLHYRLWTELWHWLWGGAGSLFLSVRFTPQCLSLLFHVSASEELELQRELCTTLSMNVWVWKRADVLGVPFTTQNTSTCFCSIAAQSSVSQAVGPQHGIDRCE